MRDRRPGRRSGESVVLGEDGVELLASVVQHVDRSGHLVCRAGLADLEDRGHEAACRLAKAAHAGVALRRLFPRRRLVGSLGDRGPAGVGQAEDLLAGGLLGGDETLVGEQLEGGIDRAGAGVPRAAAARREFLDDLVAVHGLLGEQPQDGRANVAAARAAAAREAVQVAGDTERVLEGVRTESAVAAANAAVAGLAVMISVHGTSLL